MLNVVSYQESTHTPKIMEFLPGKIGETTSAGEGSSHAYYCRRLYIFEIPPARSHS